MLEIPNRATLTLHRHLPEREQNVIFNVSSPPLAKVFIFFIVMTSELLTSVSNKVEGEKMITTTIITQSRPLEKHH